MASECVVVLKGPSECGAVMLPLRSWVWPSEVDGCGQ